MTYRSVQLYINNTKPYFSKLLNKNVWLRDPYFENESAHKTIEHTLQNTMPVQGIELDKLNPLFIYCFNNDKKTIKTTFLNIIEAFEILFPNRTTEHYKKAKSGLGGPSGFLRSRINLDSIITAEDGFNYFLVQNPIRDHIKSNFKSDNFTWVVNEKTLKANLYLNLNEAWSYLVKTENNLTIRMVKYYRSILKVYNGYLFISHVKLIEILPNIYNKDKGISELKLTKAQFNSLINNKS